MMTRALIAVALLACVGGCMNDPLEPACTQTDTLWARNAAATDSLRVLITRPCGLRSGVRP